MSYFDFEKIDVEDYLNELGLNKVSRRGNQVWFSCPLSGHMGIDKTPSASMEIGTTRMHCFGCGFSGNAVSFLSELEGVSPLKARKWLRERFEMGFFEPQNKFKDEIDKKLERIEKRHSDSYRKSSAKHSTLLDEREVDKRAIDWHKVFDAWQGKIQEAYPLAYMLDRGFHPDTLDKWAIGWDMISQRVSIPIRDENGNLVGFKARAVDNNPQRYKVLGGPEYGFETCKIHKHVFGLDLAINSPNFGGVLFVREGELNTIAISQAGFENVVGTGKILSDEQLDLIVKYARKVILSYDEYIDSLNNANRIEQFLPTMICPKADKDPADMNKYELTQYLQSASSTLVI